MSKVDKVLQAMLLQQRKTYKSFLEALIKANKLKPTKVTNSDIATKVIKTRKKRVFED
jgi:hypothetical protein